LGKKKRICQMKKRKKVGRPCSVTGKAEKKRETQGNPGKLALPSRKKEKSPHDSKEEVKKRREEKRISNP